MFDDNGTIFTQQCQTYRQEFNEFLMFLLVPTVSEYIVNSAGIRIQMRRSKENLWSCNIGRCLFQTCFLMLPHLFSVYFCAVCQSSETKKKSLSSVSERSTRSSVVSTYCMKQCYDRGNLELRSSDHLISVSR